MYLSQQLYNIVTCEIVRSFVREHWRRRNDVGCVYLGNNFYQKKIKIHYENDGTQMPTNLTGQ